MFVLSIETPDGFTQAMHKVLGIFNTEAEALEAAGFPESEDKDVFAKHGRDDILLLTKVEPGQSSANWPSKDVNKWPDDMVEGRMIFSRRLNEALGDAPDSIWDKMGINYPVIRNTLYNVFDNVPWDRSYAAAAETASKQDIDVFGDVDPLIILNDWPPFDQPPFNQDPWNGIIVSAVEGDGKRKIYVGFEGDNQVEYEATEQEFDPGKAADAALNAFKNIFIAYDTGEPS